MTLQFASDKLPAHTETIPVKMRTKTLILTAFVGALGIAGASAQVYSVNAVGYVNKSLPKGFSIVANPGVMDMITQTMGRFGVPKETQLANMALLDSKGLPAHLLIYLLISKS